MYTPPERCRSDNFIASFLQPTSSLDPSFLSLDPRPKNQHTNRTDNAIKNRYYSTMRRLQRQAVRKGGPGAIPTATIERYVCGVERAAGPLARFYWWIGVCVLCVGMCQVPVFALYNGRLTVRPTAGQFGTSGEATMVFRHPNAETPPFGTNTALTALCLSLRSLPLCDCVGRSALCVPEGAARWPFVLIAVLIVTFARRQLL